MSINSLYKQIEKDYDKFLQRTLKSFFLGWLKHALSKIVKEGKDCLLRVDG